MAIPSYIDEAIKKEIQGYNLSEDATVLITERVKGSIYATYDFDPNFRARLAAASPADREKILRDFLRDYVKSEINFETANIERQLQKVSAFHFGTSNPSGFTLSDLNPLSVRSKTKNKDGTRNFKPYEDLRNRVLEEFLPDESEASKQEFISDHRADTEKVIKEFNSGTIDLTTAQNQINDLNSKLNTGLNVTVFDEDFGDLIDHRMALIKQRVEIQQQEGALVFKNNSEKLNLINEIYAGNTSNVENFIPSGKFQTKREKEIFAERIGLSYAQVRYDPTSNKMVLLTGNDKAANDGLYEFHKNNLKKFGDLTTKNSEGAYVTLTQGNVVSSITELSYLAETTTDSILKTRALELKEKFNVVNDILNIHKIGISGVGVSASGAASLATAVTRVTDAITNNKIEFKNDEERNIVLNAIQISGNKIAAKHLLKRVEDVETKGTLTFRSLVDKRAFFRTFGTGDVDLKDIKAKVDEGERLGQITFKSNYDKEKFISGIKSEPKNALNNFIQPSMFNDGTFSNLVFGLNTEALDLGGAAGVKSLTSRSINLFNNLNKLNRANLNNFIEMVQLVGDSGYAVSKIKETLKTSIKNYTGFDVDMNLKRYFEESRKKTLTKFVSLVNEKLYKGKEKLTLKDFENLKEINQDFKGYLKKWVRKKAEDRLKEFLKARNIGLNTDILKGFSWELLRKSKYGRILEIALKRYLGRFSAYSGKAIKILFNKIPYLGPIVSKLIARYFPTKYLGRTSNSLINSFIFLGSKIGTGSGNLIERAAKIILIGCGSWVFLFVILVLSIMLVVIGALSSTSSTPYVSGSLADVTFGTFESYDQNLAFNGGRITTSGNVCVSPSSGNFFPPARTGWNNLKLSDFEGTDNTNNCKIMCNARKVMAGLQPGKDGNLNCNYNFPDLYNYDSPSSYYNTQFWCTQLIMKSYKTDDPGIDVASNGLVITMDSYLRRKNDLYDRVDLAVPNNKDDTNTLNIYNPTCVDKSNFQSGNIVILRNGTCNDYNEIRGGYKTIRGDGVVINTSSAHVEMVLKLSGNSLITISSNNVLKKLTYQVSESGCPSGKVKVVSQTKGYVGGVLTPMYLCRMYQKKQTGTFTCDSQCDIPPNNYPDL